jgi:hypothetical protein
MQYLLLVAMTLIGISTTQAQQTTAWAGYGQDHVSSSRSFQIDLYETGIQHQFKSGVTLGAWTQQGTPDITVPNMNLTAAQIGYSKRVNIFTPYATVGYGLRTRNSSTDNFYQAVVGSRATITQKWYADAQFRYRNSNEIKQFHTNRYQAGIGYNITPKVSVQANYAEIYGDARSQQYSGYLLYRF